MQNSSAGHGDGSKDAVNHGTSKQCGTSQQSEKQCSEAKSHREARMLPSAARHTEQPLPGQAATERTNAAVGARVCSGCEIVGSAGWGAAPSGKSALAVANAREARVLAKFLKVGDDFLMCCSGTRCCPQKQMPPEFPVAERAHSGWLVEIAFSCLHQGLGSMVSY